MKSKCWIWSGWKNKDGYGMKRVSYKGERVHRLAWEIAYGKIPPSMQICHHCDNRACFNPDHLFMGTNLDNMRDRDSKGRSSGYQPRGENHSLSKLTDKQIIEMRNEYAAGKTSFRLLASKYNMSRINIINIIKRKSWKHI